MSESRRPSFEDVLESARQGAPWALGSLYRRFQPGLLRLLQVIAPHRAEHLASDVWVDVASGLRRFSGDERAFRGWLATLARHRVIDGHGRAGRRPGEAVVDGTLSESAIARVVSVLPPDQADVILMRVQGGLDVEQVARALGKQPGAVRSLQHRALRRLARELGPDALTA